MLRILFLGDVVGEPGRKAVIARLPQLKEEHAIDFTVVNGENAAAGRGITGKITIELLRAGVSVITTGDHIWDQKDVVAFLDLEPRLLRPVNYPLGAPGHGSIVLETAKGKVGVINVQARTFMQPILENPFHAVEAAAAKMREETANIIVDVHGETTSEKIALGRFLDGTCKQPTNKSFPEAQPSCATRECAVLLIPFSGALSSRSCNVSFQICPRHFRSPAEKYGCGAL
jgi:metallophosphoesterase (TIGR00282 family)